MPDIKNAEPEEPDTAHLQQVPSDEAPADMFRDARDEEPVQESPKGMLWLKYNNKQCLHLQII